MNQATAAFRGVAQNNLCSANNDHLEDASGGFLDPVRHIDFVVREAARVAEEAIQSKLGEGYHNSMAKEFNGQTIIMAVCEALEREYRRLKSDNDEGLALAIPVDPQYRMHIAHMMHLETIKLRNVLSKPCPPSDRRIAEGLLEHGSFHSALRQTQNPIFDVMVASR